MNFFKPKRFLLAMILFISFETITAQGFLEQVKHNSAGTQLESIKDSAVAYFKKNGTGKGSGYKPYKRWEYEQKMNRNSKGVSLNSKQVMDEVARNRKSNSTKNIALPNQPVYTELGPHSNNLTMNSNGGVGMGRVVCIEQDPQRASTLFVAGSGGVWKSEDAGFSWKVLSDDLPYYGYSVAVHPTNSNLVLAGLGSGGIYRSLDGGKSWATTSLTFGNQHKIIFHPTNPNIVLVAGSNGVYKSINAGETFTQVFNEYMNDLDFKPSDPSVVYGCGYMFIRSTDGGNSFVRITNGLVTFDRSFLAVTPANPNYVYVVQAKDNGLGYIYRSSNSGVSFNTQLAASPSNGTNYFGYNLFESGGQAWYDMAITVSPTNAEQVWIAGIWIFNSTNGGQSFSIINSGGRNESLPFVHADVHALEWKGNTFFAGSDGGIYKSTNAGLSWSDLSNGIGNREFYRMGGLESDPYFIAAGSQDNGQSILTGNGVYNWRNWSGSDGMEVLVDYTNKNNVFACHQSGGLTNSIDGGLSQSNTITRPVDASGNALDGAWVCPFFMDPVTPTTLYLGYKELWKSTNSGLSWTKLSNFNSSNYLEAATISKSNRLFLYISDGFSIWVSQNGGTSWTNRNTGISGRVNYISVHPSNENKVTVITNAGVFKSDNAGVTWQNVTYNLPDIGKRCVLYQDSPQEVIYVGMDLGIYYLKAGASSWVEYTNGLPNVPISEMEINYSVSKLRAATYGRGLWEVPIVGDLNNNMPPIVSIISPSSAASFIAPATINLQVDAIDVDGAITNVKFYNGSTLIGTDVSAPYSFTFDGVAAGAYLISVQATDNLGVATSKEVLVSVNNPVCMFASSKITGASIGTPGTNFGTSTHDKVYDGDISTYFDAPINVAWSGINPGKTYRITGIAYYPRSGESNRMVGGKFQGSNTADFSTGIVDLATIASNPPIGWNCITITNTTPFTYLRYLGPANGYGNVAEVVFYGNETVANTAPVVSLTAPANNTTVVINANVVLTATASDNGSVSRVEFYDGTIFLGSDVTSPYSFSTTFIALGNHSITAKAIDNNGAISTSSVAVVNVVTANILPGVNLSVPFSQSSNLRAPATVNFTANAADADGTVSKVDFYNGTTLIGTDNTAPYTHAWNNVGAGNYEIKAVVTDNSGAIATSIPLFVSVDNAPCSISGSKFSGTSIGTEGSWGNSGSTRDKAFDGDISTYFDAPTDIAWTGINADQPYRVTEILYFPRAGFSGRMLGGKFQGSSTVDFSSNIVDLATISSVPINGWNCLTVSNTSSFKYLRYICAAGGVGNVAEIEFFGTTSSSNILPTVTITSPMNGTSILPGNISITANAADADGSVTKVEFYQNGTKLGEDLTAPYSFVWTNVPLGNYVLTARATDNAAGSTTSTAVNITVANTNQSPTVSITAPSNNDSFTAPAAVNIAATAADANGTVSKVEFYQNGTKIGEDLASPYTFSWTSVAVGNYALTAIATDNNGASTTSAAVNISVTSGGGNCASLPAYGPFPNVYNTGTQVKHNNVIYEAQVNGLYNVTPGTAEHWWKTVGPCGGGNQSPTVSITAPSNNASFTAPATVNIAATAADTDGTIGKVEFYQNGTKIGEDLTSPYTFSWTSVAAGTYALTAKATDNGSASTTSATVNITVTTSNQSPTVSITAPSNNASFTAPATVNIAATAADADGTIGKVEFYQNGTKIGEDLTSPYTFSWTSVAAGTYALTAKATDNGSASTTSATVNITVTTSNQSPTVSITAPSNNATFTAPATVNIAATAADADGTIGKVEFYQNGTKIGEDLTSPYTFSWTSVAAGTYALTAKATDNGSAATTSATVNITVTTSNQSPTVSITAPSNNATFTAPATVNIAATAADADGTIGKVEFYQNGTKIGEDLTSPYTFSWTSVAAGTYALTAKATDNGSAATTSATVNITVTSSGGCSSAQWTVGNGGYVAGTVVKNTVSGVVRKYSCTIAGWCQSTSAYHYEPGNGANWQDCWTDLGVCNSRTGEVDYVESSYSVYPNPANSTITIKGVAEGYVQISVINSTGAEVLTKEVQSQQELITDLDVYSLGSGIYTIKIISGDRVILKNFIKN